MHVVGSIQIRVFIYQNVMLACLLGSCFLQGNSNLQKRTLQNRTIAYCLVQCKGDVSQVCRWREPSLPRTLTLMHFIAIQLDWNEKEFFFFLINNTEQCRILRKKKSCCLPKIIFSSITYVHWLSILLREDKNPSCLQWLVLLYFIYYLL